jgi:thymidylate kinase
MKTKIITIGFDGPNRVGKGTQCIRLQKWLADHEIPSLIIRGAGSRRGKGEQPGDPQSLWWQEVNLWLHTPQASCHDWNMTAYRLARELLVWRDRVLPNWVKSAGQEFGVLIVDRSLLSRTMIPRAMGLADIAHNLYPEQARLKGRRIWPELVCPDLIFNLTAPWWILNARLDSSDPKYEFRKKVIAETYHWFKDAVTYLSKPLQARVVEIDSSRDIEVVFSDVLAILLTHFDCLKRLDDPNHDS